jgi:hypothetical protein
MNQPTKSSHYVPSSSLFAQLLASEKIRVTVDENASTASFEPHTRVLVLPSWKGFESDAWYLFIAHEVGHAKFTPGDWMKNPSVTALQARYGVTIGQVHSVLNVLEDIRIERLMRVQFQGLSGFFSRGYAELVSRDFFRFGPTMSPARWAKYGILDKLNLYGKIGSLCGLTLTNANHIKWYNQALKMQTFEDVLSLAGDIIHYVKTEKAAESTQSHQASEKAAEKAEEARKAKADAKKAKEEAAKAEEKAKQAEKEASEADKEAEKTSKNEDLESKTEEAKEDNLREATKDKTETDNVSKSEDGEDTEDETADESHEDASTEDSEESEETSDSTTEPGESGESDETSNEPNGEDLPEQGQNGDNADGAGEDIEETEAAPGESNKQSAGTSEEADEEADTDSDLPGQPGESSGSGEDIEDTEDLEGTGNAGTEAGASDDAETRNDSLTSDTFEAGNKALEDATKTYQGDSCVILPTDLSYLNEGDIALAEVLENWKAPQSLRQTLTEAVAAHRREAGPVLAGMVAAFRANQSATQQRKVQVSRTGTIDPTRLASFKLTEDIFLRRSSTPKGQNHGFVIHVDWSGSMQDVMPTVLWQMLHLIWLAETIKVPVEVYAFTTHARGYNSYYGAPATSKTANTATNVIRAKNNWAPWESNNNVVSLYDSAAPMIIKRTAEAHILSLIYRFSNLSNELYNVMTYGLNGKTFDATDYAKPILQVASRTDITNYDSTVFSNLPLAVHTSIDKVLGGVSWNDLRADIFSNTFANLGGTPLCHAILSSVKTVRSFRERNRVEQCVSIWLTDGEDGSGVTYQDPAYTANPSRAIPAANIFFPQTGKTYENTGERLALATIFDMHRDATGANIVMIDLNSEPQTAVQKLLTKAEAKTLTADLAKIDEDGNAYTEKTSRRRVSRWNRNRRVVRIPVEAPKLSKRAAKSTVIIKKTKGTFGTDGMMSISRTQFENMGADAYIVADPAVFGSSSVYADRAVKRSMADALDDSSMTSTTSRAVTNLITAQSAVASQKRFAEVVVPFLADAK